MAANEFLSRKKIFPTKNGYISQIISLVIMFERNTQNIWEKRFVYYNMVKVTTSVILM